MANYFTTYVFRSAIGKQENRKKKTKTKKRNSNNKTRDGKKTNPKCNCREEK